MLATAISTKGQVVLPKVIRDELGITPGMRCEIKVVDGDILLKPFKQSTIERLYGRFKNTPLIDDLEAEHAAELAAE